MVMPFKKRAKALSTVNCPISVVMLPFLPNEKFNFSEATACSSQARRTRTPGSEECFLMAERINRQMNPPKDQVPVLLLGAPLGNPHYSGRCLEEYFQRIMLPGSSITFVSHGNPLVLGTMSGHFTSPQELASQIDKAFMPIISDINLTAQRRYSEEGYDSISVPTINKQDIRTQFDFQHCNSGLYMFKNVESAMTSFVGRFITSMRQLGYTGISVVGYRGYIGEINDKKTKVFPVEGDTRRVFGPEVCQLKITQSASEFIVTHPMQFDKINVDCQKIMHESMELLKESSDVPDEVGYDLPTPPRLKKERCRTINRLGFFDSVHSLSDLTEAGILSVDFASKFSG
jgi:hypothetical protein